MKRLAIVSLAVLALAGNLPAAEPAAPKPEYFLIHEEVARPSMLGAYESTTRDLLAAMKEQHADPKTFGMRLYMTTDFHYLFVIPMDNWAALDHLNPAFEALSVAVGRDKWRALMKAGNQTMSSYNEFVVMRRPDLSYEPENPRVKPEERTFHHWEFYFLDAEHVEEAEQVAKDWAALFKAKNVSEAFTIYMAQSGHDLPLLVVDAPGKSASDFYASEERIATSIGADIMPLQMRALAITRRFETRDGISRPDLSYPGPAAAAMTK
jgi:hypothetical protein